MGLEALRKDGGKGFNEEEHRVDHTSDVCQLKLSAQWKIYMTIGSEISATAQ